MGASALAVGGALGLAGILHASILLVAILGAVGLLLAFEAFHDRNPFRFLGTVFAYTGVLSLISWISLVGHSTTNVYAVESLAFSIPAAVCAIAVSFVASRLLAGGARPEFERALGLSVVAGSAAAIVTPSAITAAATACFVMSFVLLVALPVVVATVQMRAMQSTHSPIDNADTTPVAPPTGLSRSEARARIDTVLATLSNEHTVFSQVSLPKTGEFDHLVIGPTGITLIAAVPTTDLPHFDTREGWLLPGADTSTLTGTLIAQREELSAALRISTDRISLMLVAVDPEATDRSFSYTAAAYLLGERTPRAQVRIVGLSSLREALDWGLASDSPGTVQQAVWRARRAVRSARLPLASVAAAPTVKVPYALGRTDADGGVYAPTIISDALPTWCITGALIDIHTSRGILGDLRIAGDPVRDASSLLIVPVCLDEEWEAAQRQNRRPRTQLVPLDTVQPVPTSESGN